MEDSSSPARLRGKPGQGAQVSVPGGFSRDTQTLGRSFGGAGSCDAKAQLLCQHLEGEIGVRVTGTSPCADKVMFMAFMVRATRTITLRPAY